MCHATWLAREASARCSRWSVRVLAWCVLGWHVSCNLVGKGGFSEVFKVGGVCISSVCGRVACVVQSGGQGRRQRGLKGGCGGQGECLHWRRVTLNPNPFPPPNPSQAYDLHEARAVCVKIHAIAGGWPAARREHYVRHAIREYDIHRE